MDQDVFTPVDTSGVSQVDQTKDYFAELVGEGKKFADAKALARGKAESDAFIAKLQKEQAELREELNKRLTAEDLLKKLEERNSKPQGNVGTAGDTTPNGQQGSEVAGGSASELKLEDIEKLLSDRLVKRDQEETERANLNRAVSKAREVWGENTQVELNRKATQLGMTLDQLKDHAKKNPSVFLTLVGITPAQAQQTSVNNTVTPQSTTNPAAVSQSAGGKNERYYQNLRKSDPKLYFSKEIQIEMHNEAIRQGEAFFS